MMIGHHPFFYEFYEFYGESRFNPLNPLTRSFLILYIIKYKNNSIYSKETKETPRTAMSGLQSGLERVGFFHPKPTIIILLFLFHFHQTP